MPQPPKNSPPPLPTIESNVGAQIARIRKDQGLSQEALAEVMGISRKRVVDYETGRIHLNDEMIVRFAVTLNVSADQLLGLKPPKKSLDEPMLRLTRRLRELSNLPEDKKRAIFTILDDLIKANK
jgi:transcriptional regulator with XRE-family HTH domain